MQAAEDAPDSPTLALSTPVTLPRLEGKLRTCGRAGRQAGRQTGRAIAPGWCRGPH